MTITNTLQTFDTAIAANSIGWNDIQKCAAYVAAETGHKPSDRKKATLIDFILDHRTAVLSKVDNQVNPAIPSDENVAMVELGHAEELTNVYHGPVPSGYRVSCDLQTYVASEVYSLERYFHQVDAWLTVGHYPQGTLDFTLVESRDATMFDKMVTAYFSEGVAPHQSGEVCHTAPFDTEVDTPTVNPYPVDATASNIHNMGYVLNDARAMLYTAYGVLLIVSAYMMGATMGAVQLVTPPAKRRVNKVWNDIKRLWANDTAIA